MSADQIFTGSATCSEHMGMGFSYCNLCEIERLREKIFEMAEAMRYPNCHAEDGPCGLCCWCIYLKDDEEDE